MSARFSSLGKPITEGTGTVVGIATYGSDNVKRLIVKRTFITFGTEEWLRVTIPAPYDVQIGDVIEVHAGWLLWVKAGKQGIWEIPKLGNALYVEGAL